MTRQDVFYEAMEHIAGEANNGSDFAKEIKDRANALQESGQRRRKMTAEMEVKLIHCFRVLLKRVKMLKRLMY